MKKSALMAHIEATDHKESKEEDLDDEENSRKEGAKRQLLECVQKEEISRKV